MSWDVSVRVRSGPDAFLYSKGLSYTYNVAPMFELAGIPDGSLNDLDGWLCPDVLPLLREAVRAMEEHPKLYINLNPSNGWGNYEGAVEFLRGIVALCEENIYGSLEVQ